jgi:hypothetical protein
MNLGMDCVEPLFAVTAHLHARICSPDERDSDQNPVTQQANGE